MGRKEGVRAAFSAMYYAAHGGDRETVNLLRQAGAEITLTEAAAVGDLETVRRMLDEGRNPNWRDVMGEIPLRCCSEKGHVAIARLLLARGADPFALSGKESFCETALWAAIGAEQTEAISVLLESILGVDLTMSREEISKRIGNASDRAKLLAL